MSGGVNLVDGAARARPWCESRRSTRFLARSVAIAVGDVGQGAELHWKRAPAPGCCSCAGHFSASSPARGAGPSKG